MIRSVQLTRFATLTRTRIAYEHSAMPPPLTYANYLDLEKLLTLEKPRSAPVEHDESVSRSDADAATGALPTLSESISQPQ
jgi:hypothetical protein